MRNPLRRRRRRRHATRPDEVRILVSPEYRAELERGIEFAGTILLDYNGDHDGLGVLHLVRADADDVGRTLVERPRTIEDAIALIGVGIDAGRAWLLVDVDRETRELYDHEIRPHLDQDAAGELTDAIEAAIRTFAGTVARASDDGCDDAPPPREETP